MSDVQERIVGPDHHAVTMLEGTTKLLAMLGIFGIAWGHRGIAWGHRRRRD